jgi:prepilin signal peptidase PulO-like enzyme (type II secretory pathway)
MTLIPAAIILGLIVGSFLSMLIPRLHNDEAGIFIGRSKSHCCKKILNAIQLIPLVSFLMQKGRCNNCETKIPYWYPALELTTALTFTGLLLKSSSTEMWIWNSLLFTVLIFIFFYDLRYKEIHDAVMLPGILLALFVSIIHGTWESALIGGAIGFAFFGIQWLVSQGRWLGSGDIRIGIFMGLMLGWQHMLLALVSSYIIGSIISIFLLATKRATAKTAIPLGPFLVLGTVLAFCYGDLILNWYL